MKEDIIRMAREAGGLGYVHDAGDDPHKWQFTVEELQAFAALVAAAEREECVRICCEHWLNGGNAMECADAIRARGQE